MKVEESAPKRSNPVASTIRLFEAFLLLAAIAYGFVWLASRTGGFRSLAEERLSAAVGMPVKIGNSYARWNLDLVFENVRTVDNGRANQPGIRVRRLELDWTFAKSLKAAHWMPTRISMEDGSITFATTVTGQWEPSALAPMSEQVASWLGVKLKTHVRPDVEAAPSAAPARPSVETGSARQLACGISAHNFEVQWWADGDAALAAMRGLNVDATPMLTPGRSITHYLVKLDEVKGANNFEMNDATLELLDVGDQQVVLAFHSQRAAPLDLTP